MQYNSSDDSFINEEPLSWEQLVGIYAGISEETDFMPLPDGKLFSDVEEGFILTDPENFVGTKFDNDGNLIETLTLEGEFQKLQE